MRLSAGLPRLVNVTPRASCVLICEAAPGAIRLEGSHFSGGTSDSKEAESSQKDHFR